MITAINFRQISETVPVRDYVKTLGINIDGSGKIICPFHNDKRASMKVDKRYHCFGCGEDGDVINFVSKYFGVSLSEAAMKIASEFGIEAYGNGTKTGNYDKVSLEPYIDYKEIKQFLLNHLINLFKELQSWIEEYKPQNEDDDLHFLFVTAIHKIDYVSYLIDTLIQLKTDEEVKTFIENHSGEVIL